MSDPFQVVRDFEQALCEYTGAPYAVTTTSCSMAILLSLKYWGYHLEKSGLEKHPITIPSRTYVSIPQAIKLAGFSVDFEDTKWSGNYVLSPYPIIDSARWMTSGMYSPGTYLCLSFHWSKHLSIGQGGCILTDDQESLEWLRKMRFDGRTEGLRPKDDHFEMIAYHAYMSPRDAAEGLSRLALLPKHNEPLPNDDYPDLSQFEVFK